MKKVVLGHKTILTHGLTWEQATQLQIEIRQREELKPLFKDKAIWLSSDKNHTWYLYIVDDALKEHFLSNPKSFVFDIDDEKQGG